MVTLSCFSTSGSVAVSQTKTFFLTCFKISCLPVFLNCNLCWGSQKGGDALFGLFILSGISVWMRTSFLCCGDQPSSCPVVWNAVCFINPQHPCPHGTGWAGTWAAWGILHASVGIGARFLYKRKVCVWRWLCRSQPACFFSITFIYCF